MQIVWLDALAQQIGGYVLQHWPIALDLDLAVVLMDALHMRHCLQRGKALPMPTEGDLCLPGILRHQPGRAIERHNAPLLHHRHALAEALDLIHEMAHQHDGGPLGLNLLNQFPGGMARCRVEAGCHFIEEDNFWPVHQR